MDIKIGTDPNKTVVSAVPDGQVFFAESVGIGKKGVYIKDGYAVWPIKDGRKAPEGKQFTSPSCPIVGYDPINFVF